MNFCILYATNAARYQRDDCDFFRTLPVCSFSLFLFRKIKLGNATVFAKWSIFVVADGEQHFMNCGFNCCRKRIILTARLHNMQSLESSTGHLYYGLFGDHNIFSV